MPIAADRPRVLVTRRLPDDVESRLGRNYRAVVNADDEVLTRDDLLARAIDVDAVLTTPTERWPADLVDVLPGQVRIIATFSVGFEHIDLNACRRRGIVVTNTP